MRKQLLSALLCLSLCLGLLPAPLAVEEEPYLISITTADAVVTWGYRDAWRWVALSRADPGRAGILLRGEDPDVSGSLKRSDGLTPGDALDAWGKAQDGKPATLTLGKESWECTARYKDYGSQSVLYVEFPPSEGGTRRQPSFETIQLFRYGWAQENAARYTAALEKLLHEEGYVVDQQVKSPSSTLVLRHRDVEGYRDYELYWVAQSAHIGYEDPVKRLLLPSTTLMDGHAPTDRAPDSIFLSEDGESFIYTYSFPTPLLDGETVLHEAGSYVYKVDAISGTTSTVHASGGQVAELARKLKALGLFLGDESGNFNLDKAPTRTEALVMLIRALGEEVEAKYKSPRTPHPFTDVPEWADGYVSWGYEKGYTKGISATEFGADTVAGSDMYLTFMLRALGYSDGEGGQFTWNDPYLLAYEAEILPFEADYVHFTRGDAVTVTSAALWADLPGTDKTLADRLAEQRFFTTEQFTTQFPSDPFLWEHSLKPLVAKALEEADPTGQTDRKTIRAQTHIIAYAADRSEAQIRVYALAGHASRELDAEGGYDSSGSGVGCWTIDLSAKTGQVLSCVSGGDLEDLPFSMEEWNARTDLFFPVLRAGAEARLEALANSGEVGYKAPTYEQAVAELRSGMGHSNEQTFETDLCTVFVYDRGGFMRAPTGAIQIIYKPGSPLGDGYVLDPPHVRSEYSITPADTMSFAPERQSFTYSYFYETSAWDSSIQSYDTRVEPGTFTFTVDLPTGEVHREYRPVDYAGAMAHVTRKRIATASEHSEDREVVRTLEAPECTVILTRGRYLDRYDDCILSLVYKPNSSLGEGTIKRLLLPSTVYAKGYSYHPTDRAPDTLELSRDGKSLTYSYHFVEALEDFHDAGTYTYTVDLPTGEWSVSHTPN